MEYHKRNTIERLAERINRSPTTVWRWVKQGMLRSHTSSIKLDLTARPDPALRKPRTDTADSPKQVRASRFSLEVLEFGRIANLLRFRTMYNTVDIDEKWFYITKTMQRFYLTPAKEDPHTSCKSKALITKLMFMCAVCRPIYDQDGCVVFDENIWIFPFTQHVPAQRDSRNREKGTLETKPI